MRHDLHLTWLRLKRYLGSRNHAARARYEAVNALCAALVTASASAVPSSRSCLCRPSWGIAA
jgi:hypothetical protein